MTAPNGAESTAHKRCGLTELILFLIAIASGTACSICSKTMMELHAVGMTGEVELFEKPLFQTIGMFVGMLFGLVMHWMVLFFRIPFPGYDFTEAKPAALPLHTVPAGKVSTEEDALLPGNGAPVVNNKNYVPYWMYFFLAIPSLFDLGATALCMMGLRYINVSIYQMLRGSGIIFVAIMKQYVLKDRLYKFQWLGISWNVLSVFLVGATAMLSSQTDANPETDAHEAFLGVMLVLTGAFVQALQFVFEEKVMTMDVPSPPLLLIGMEGFWGTFLCLFVLYPIAYILPGDDHGSYEDPYNTWYMFWHSSTIKWAFFIYFFAIFAYNLFAVLVTFMLNSVWHAILDNFRPMTVWSVDMFIFYVISQDHGEPWTSWSSLQLAGMCVLLYGTAIYNAPNAGSLPLKGEWYSFGFNFSPEYHDIELREEEERRHNEWVQRKQSFIKRRSTGSFAGEWLGQPRM